MKKLLYLLIGLCISSSWAGAYDDFFQAVNRDDGSGVSRILGLGFDANSRDPQGQSALHLSLRDNSPRVTEALLKSANVDVNALNANGETPLMMAALRGELEWVRRLLDRGAKVHQEGW